MLSQSDLHASAGSSLLGRLDPFHLNWSAKHAGQDAAALGGDPLLACWTLVRSAVASELGRTLPADAPGGSWERIAPEEARDLDLLVFGYGGMDTHLGLVVVDRGGERKMLHLPEGGASVVEPYDCEPWRNVLKGVYRLGEASPATADSAVVAGGSFLAPPKDVLIMGRPFITAGEERALTVAPGLSVAELVAELYPAAFGGQLDRMRVTIGASIVEREAWSIIPAAGATVLVEPLPGVFGLRSILQVGLAIAAFAAAVAIGNPALGFAASTAIVPAGDVILNELLP